MLHCYPAQRVSRLVWQKNGKQTWLRLLLPEFCVWLILLGSFVHLLVHACKSPLICLDVLCGWCVWSSRRKPAEVVPKHQRRARLVWAGLLVCIASCECKAHRRARHAYGLIEQRLAIGPSNTRSVLLFCFSLYSCPKPLF